MNVRLKKKQYFRHFKNKPVAGLVVRVLRIRMSWSDSLSPHQGGVIPRVLSSP